MAKKRTPLVRFDLTDNFISALSYAVSVNLIDATEAFVYGVNFGNNPVAVLSDLCEVAYSHRHTPGGSAIHGHICEYHDNAVAEAAKKA
ncbi:MAG TPA: hypothetical protein VI911_09750 [Patescibacteria group bacterium]|nr:hypothetical protein [Patescibacteria group bacterium]